MAEKDGQDFLETKPEIRLAQHIAKKYGLKPGFNIEQFASEFVNVQKDAIPYDVDGLFFGFNTEGKKPTIMINSEISPRRQLFTLAHEIGHFFIPWHIGLIICHIDVNDPFLDYIYGETETEANRFAAELLMPSELISERIKDKSVKEVIEVFLEQ